MTVAVYITDAYGYRIAEVTGYTRLQCASSLNTVGHFSLDFPAQEFPRALFFQSGTFAIDRRIEVWRAPRGRDLRLVFCGFIRTYSEDSQDYGYTEDYSKEGTFCYAAGEGQKASRVLTDAQNAARLLASPLNRCEIFHQNTNEGDLTVLVDGAQEKLYQERAKIEFYPKNIELDYIYPHDWNLGDVLRVNAGTPESVTISGPDLGDLLRRRIIAYKTEEPEAKKNAEADDMIKAYVYENLGAGAPAARQLPAALGFVIAADTTSAPVVEYSASFGKLLDVCKRVSERSAEEGTPLFFGVRPVITGGRVVPRFETAITRWGHDRTDLSIGSGNRQQDLTVSGVQLTVNAGVEEVTPRFAQEDD